MFVRYSSAYNGSCSSFSDLLGSKQLSSQGFCSLQQTWKISSLWDSKECSLRRRLRRSQRATVRSALPVARMYSLYGLNERQLTSALWASTEWLALDELLERVSHLRQRDNDSEEVMTRSPSMADAPLTSSASGRQRPSQRYSHEVDARPHPPPLKCGH